MATKGYSFAELQGGQPAEASVPVPVADDSTEVETEEEPSPLEPEVVAPEKFVAADRTKTFKSFTERLHAEQEAVPGGGGKIKGWRSSRATRNNNPGNVKDVGQFKKMPGYKGKDDKGFAIFDSPETGFKVQEAQLKRYLNGKTFGKKLKTIRQIVGKWSPVDDPENKPGSTGNYMGFVGRQLGRGLDEDIKESDLPALARAMATFEGFGSDGAAPGVVVAGGSDVPPEAAGEGFSFAELQGEPVAPTKGKRKYPETVVGQGMDLAARFVTSQVKDSPKIIAQKAGEAWDVLKQRIFDKPGELRGQPVRRLSMTPEQITATTAGMNETDAKKVTESLTAAANQDIRIPSVDEEAAMIQTTEQARESEVTKGFWDTLENPTKLILEDSLPANFIESVIRAPDHAFKKAQEATKIIQQNDIVSHPERFPAVTVEAAKRAIAEREAAEKMPKPSTKEMFKQLWAEAQKNPGGMAAQLANALMADPYLVFAPEGAFLRAGAAAEKGATVATRASRLATTIKSKGARAADAMATGAGMNLAIEETAAASEGEELTTSERINAALTGGVPAALLSVFTRGASARDALKSRTGPGGKTLNEADLKKAMDDTADETAVTEDMVTHPERWTEDKVDIATKQRIEEQLGITNLSEAERLALAKQRKAELKEAFSPEEWQAWKARYAESQKAIRESQTAQAAKAVEDQQRRTQRLGSQYDEAELARERARALGEEEAAFAENDFRDATKKLDEQEVFEASLDGDVPQIRNAMLNATRRDAKLARPKWQRGEVDPRYLTSLGVGSLFAGTAYALSPEDQKVRNALIAGITPFAIPKGRGVLRRMKQSGAVSAEGELFELANMIRDNKLRPDRDVAQQVAHDGELVTKAKQGDVKAFEQIFKENYPALVRRSKRYARDIIDPEDLAQETMELAWKKLDTYEPDMPILAWLSTIAHNKGSKMIRDLTETEKRGAGETIESASRKGVVTPHGETVARDAFDEGAGSEFVDTPESVMTRKQVRQISKAVLEKTPDKQKLAFLLAHSEGMKIKDIAVATGMPEGTVGVYIQRTGEAITNAIKKELGMEDIPDPMTRGRGRARAKRQGGSIDERLLQAGGAIALGAGVGIYANKDNRLAGALSGATVAGILMARTKSGKRIASSGLEAADYAGGMISTRVMEKSKKLWWKMHETERIILRDTHALQERVKPFVDMLHELPEETQGILSRAILTGKPGVVDKLLDALGDPELKTNWKEVRSVLDSVGDQLVHYKRFKKKDMDYFPRMVKDVQGLIKALGGNRGSFVEEALKKADKEALKSRGTGLTELEKSLVVNKILKEEKHRSQQPGYAKDRVIEEITPELQQFYHTPAESLDMYLRSAVEDIERAKFFGEDLKVTKDANGNEYTNVDQSIGAVVTKLMNEGKISPDDFDKISSMLKSRWINGERAPHEVTQAAKNLSYAGLLGNPLSAASQLGDAVIQAYTQDIGSALRAVVQVVTGNKKLDMKDFGLVNHIAEEFSTTTKSAKALNKIFKYSLFSGVDAFGKNVALNAAANRLGKLVKSEDGIKKIQAKYEDHLGQGEIDQLIKDLQKGEMSDLVNAVSFAELTRSQPVTRLELSQAYLDNPNGRLLYQYKTFALKQMDLARRDGINEIRKGNRAQGVRKLAELGIALGTAGAATSVVKDFMMNGVLALTGNETKEIDVDLEDIPMNAMKTFGITEYLLDHTFGVSKEEARERRAEGEKGARAIKADPVSALTPGIAPASMFMDIARGNKKAWRYLPFIGPFAYEIAKQEEAK